MVNWQIVELTNCRIDKLSNWQIDELTNWQIDKLTECSDWLSKDYQFVESEMLRDFVKARLKVFQEEELDVELVVFDDVLEHVLRIDRVLKQPMGHCLLVGDSGAGKTVLSKFVAWMNGLSIFQIKAHSKYKMEDFNNDLREVMKRVGCGNEKVCFIFF